MIARMIHGAIAVRGLVLVLSTFLALMGLVALRSTPVDAIPDLSDVQVIIRTSWPGQAPQIVENQVTYPLTTTMLSVPGARTVRGYSFMGDSFVYVLFEEGTDLYWARSRVLEYLAQVRGSLPPGASAALGPDATGVGWIYQYALVDRSGRHDLGQLRGLQDWFLRFELKTVPGVSEVASIGGMVREHQILLDPDKLSNFGVTAADVGDAIRQANQEAGGSVVEMAGAEHVVRASGYLRTPEDFRAIPLRVAPGALPVSVGDVAIIQRGPGIRRGFAELDGEGEVVGGVIVMRQGENARAVIEAVDARIAALRPSLPKGVEIVTTYDRSGLIDRAIANLRGKLVAEFVIVALVCLLFLWHARSALVVVITLPLGILAAFLIMRVQGLNANILSLGGIAIAIGAMVDAAIVMIENAHKHLERRAHEQPGEPIAVEERWRIVGAAAAEVGPALFLSLLIITVSFVPIFALEGQEGRLFAPLAFTKTWAMAAAALLSITLVPVLMGYLIRGRIPAEEANPLNRGLTRLYRPAIDAALARPRAALLLAALLFATSLWPLSQTGGEFLPRMDEGDLLYMPSALPGIAPSEVGRLLQQTNRMIRTVPEVAQVFGKAGRADTATDPAPLEMFETTVRFKPQADWRPGMTPEKLLQELDAAVQVPGLANFWIPPIRNRLDMLATGVKSPIGVRVSGGDLAQLERVATNIEEVARGVLGVQSALAERLAGGRYIDIDIDRAAAARFGLSIRDVHAVVTGAIGGEIIGETVEGLARYPISLRFPRELRTSFADLEQLPIQTRTGEQITLGSIARIKSTSGPPMMRSENARLATFVYVDNGDRPLAAVVADLGNAIQAQVKLPPGVSVTYTGQFEYLERARDRLMLVVPLTLAIIFGLLYLAFRRWDEALLIMATLPFALTGGLWLQYLLGYSHSVATVVGFIALAGVAAEFGVIMLIYLKHALDDHPPSEMKQAIRAGALLRVRPKAMTVAVILAGLLPILVGSGTGSEMMRRIAAPMVGGMLSAPLLSMLVIPAAYLMMRQRANKVQLEGDGR